MEGHQFPFGPLGDTMIWIDLHRSVMVGGIGGVVGRGGFPLSHDSRGIGVSGLARAARLGLLLGGGRVLVGGIFGFRFAAGLLAGHTGSGQADLGTVLGWLLGLHDAELGSARTGINNYLIHGGGSCANRLYGAVKRYRIVGVVLGPLAVVAVPTGEQVPVLSCPALLCEGRYRVRGPVLTQSVSCRVVSVCLLGRWWELCVCVCVCVVNAIDMRFDARAVVPRYRWMLGSQVPIGT